MLEYFEFIINNYNSEKLTEFADNELAITIRQKIPREILAELQLNSDKYRITASAGQGNWAAVPWIAIFDKEITETATKGYDIVYLFRTDMSGFYISLNQGWTYFKEKYGTKAGKVNIKKVSNTWKKLLSSTLNDFSFDSIDLKVDGQHTDLPLGYELGHICGKFYKANDLPDNQVLIDDLRNLLSVYRELKGQIQDSSIEKTNNYILAGEEAGLFEVYEKTDELNNVFANSMNATLTLHNSPDSILNQEHNFGSARKVNYISKQIRDMKIGLAGEKMVVEYEKNRLVNEGRPDLIDRIEHTALDKGDGVGYDILSFDKEGKEIYIEVKTTSAGIDSPFYITESEIIFSEKNKENYWLYRVYDFDEKNITASLYIVPGNLKERFHFNPINYVSDGLI